MEHPRPGPPPVPLRVDLGEIEESVLEIPEHVLVSVSPLVNVTHGLEIAEPIITHDNPQPIVKADEPRPIVKADEPQPIVKDDKPRLIVKNDKPVDVNVTENPPSILPNTSKHPVSKSTKLMQKKEPKSRPTISIISARPMDQASSCPSVQFKNDEAELATNENNVNNNINVQQSATAPVTERSPGLKKPSKPAPPAPRKSPKTKLDDKNPKPADTSRKQAPVPSVRSKTKRETGSVFYIDATADSSIGTASSSTPIIDKPSNEVIHKSKQAASKPNNKSKPILPAPWNSKTKDEQKNSEIAPVVNTKVKPPDKTISKPKLKPTIITAKTPKQLVGNKDDGVKISSSESVNTSSVSKAVDEIRPSRPNFAPSDNTEDVNKNENQPVRPKAPPNTTKEEKKAVEKKQEQKTDPKNEQSENKRSKSKPARPPMAKESARPKPSRPAPAKPSVTRKLSSKAKVLSKGEKMTTDNSALSKPSGPPRAHAKFDYTEATDDDLAFKAGDTILLTSKVDDDWLVGYLEKNVMHQGLFPSSFVDIVVPLKEQLVNQVNKKSVPPEPHAVAVHDFQGQSEGELSFSSGQTIILLERINAEWLMGKSSDTIGIFPANFVQIEHDLPLTIASKNNVETTPLGLTDNNVVKETVCSEEWCRAIHDYQGEHIDDLSFAAGTKIKIIERVSPEWFKGECSGKCGIFPASFVEFIAEDSKASQETSFVTAVHNYPGGNSGDLSFKTGDKIKVIEKINSAWLMGECNGNQGLFPASFVEVGQSESVIQTKENIRMAKAIHEFTGKNPGELNFSVGDVIQVQREIDSNWSEGIINDVSGIFPTAFVEIEPLVSKDEIHAKALYDFAGESEHDLSFKAGDMIQLLEHVNEDWCTGIAGGKTGHFPSSFVEILASR